MSSCTDLLRLNEKRVFVDIRESLCGAKETRNVLEIRDNVLYVWYADKCRVLTFNIAAIRGKAGEDAPYQVSFTRLCYALHALFGSRNRTVVERASRSLGTAMLSA